MLIYISGAISSDPDYREKFRIVSKRLIEKGHDVINPALFDSCLPELTHEQYLHIDKALIDICDAVYFLKDWGSSKGAREEYEYVRKKNEEEKLIKLIFEGENEDEI